RCRDRSGASREGRVRGPGNKLRFDPKLGPVVITAALILLIVGAMAAPRFLGLPSRSADAPASSDADDSPDLRPGRPEVFRYYSEPLGSLDPALASDAYSSIVIAQIFSPPAGLTSDLEPVPHVAACWTVARRGVADQSQLHSA